MHGVSLFVDGGMTFIPDSRPEDDRRDARTPGADRALRGHWPEYLIEGSALGLFMVSAAVFSTLLFAADSPLRRLLVPEGVRRACIGVAMGLTAIALIHSPWGKRSGAHMNPAVTLTFLRLGKVARWDAAFYILAQFAGGWLGVQCAAVLLAPPSRLCRSVMRRRFLASSDPPARSSRSSSSPRS